MSTTQQASHELSTMEDDAWALDAPQPNTKEYIVSKYIKSLECEKSEHTESRANKLENLISIIKNNEKDMLMSDFDDIAKHVAGRVDDRKNGRDMKDVMRMYKRMTLDNEIGLPISVLWDYDRITRSNFAERNVVVGYRVHKDKLMETIRNKKIPKDIDAIERLERMIRNSGCFIESIDNINYEERNSDNKKYVILTICKGDRLRILEAVTNPESILKHYDQENFEEIKKCLGIETKPEIFLRKY